MSEIKYDYLNRLKVVTLDPGFTTGYTVSVREGLSFKVFAGQTKFSHLGLYQWLIDTNPDQVICEQFEYRKGVKDKVELYPKELIGVVHLYNQFYKEAGTLTLQSAAKGKSYFNDDKIKELGLYRVSNKHAMDAIRHLLHWFTFGAGFRFNNEPTFILVDKQEEL